METLNKKQNEFVDSISVLDEFIVALKKVLSVSSPNGNDVDALKRAFNGTCVSAEKGLLKNHSESIGETEIKKYILRKKEEFDSVLKEKKE